MAVGLNELRTPYFVITAILMESHSVVHNNPYMMLELMIFRHTFEKVKALVFATTVELTQTYL